MEKEPARRKRTVEQRLSSLTGESSTSIPGAKLGMHFPEKKLDINGSEVADYPFSNNPSMSGITGPNFVVAGNDIQSGFSIGSMNDGSLLSKLKDINPQSLNDTIKRAQKYAQSDDLLADLIRIKQTFMISGFSLQPQPDEDTDPDTVKNIRKSIKFASRRYKLPKVVSDLSKDYIETDSAILYWRVEKTEGGDESDGDQGIGYIKGLVDVCAISPSDVDWDNSIGEDVLKVVVPDKIREKIEKALDITNKDGKRQLQELIESGVGEKWINAVKDYKRTVSSRGPMVRLDNKDGDYWVIISKKRKHFGLATPSMQSIFLALETRRAMAEGEFLAAYILQHFIMLIKQGESIDSGPLSGMRTNWMTPGEAEGLVKIFSTMTKAMRLALNHTTKIEFIVPPETMFNTQKFESSESRIFNWSDIDKGVVTGQGGTYSGGFIGIKKLISSIIHSRDQLSYLFDCFLTHKTIAPSLGIPPDCIVTAVFDENVLKEPAQLLSEIKALSNIGAIDPVTALSELGRDPDSIRHLKEKALEEINNNGLWLSMPDYVRTFLEASGLKNKKSGEDGDPGRPPNDGTTVNELTKIQRPTPAS